MMLVLLFWLLAAEPVVLRDEINVVPPGQWRYDSFVLKSQLPATVDCTYVVAMPGVASAALMTKESLHAMLRGGEYDTLARAEGGRLTKELSAPGEFALVIKNDSKKLEARVAVRLTIHLADRLATSARYLSTERRFTVILLSSLGFLAIVTLSGLKLLTALRR